MPVFFIESDEQKISNQITKILNKELQNIEKEIRKSLPQKLKQINGEIYASYRVIVQNTVEQVFIEYFGDSFDLMSLRDSIIYPSINNFQPNFSYNKNKIKFYNTMDERYSPFNLNARKDEMRKSKPNDPDFFTGSFWDLMNEDDFGGSYFEDYGYTGQDYDDEIDYYNSLLNDYNDFTPANSKIKYTLSLDKVFEIARSKALQEFDKEYKIHIKPQILKKYGIKLG